VVLGTQAPNTNIKTLSIAPLAKDSCVQATKSLMLPTPSCDRHETPLEDARSVQAFRILRFLDYYVTRFGSTPPESFIRGADAFVDEPKRCSFLLFKKASSVDDYQRAHKVFDLR
jgi:hypothetical protein